MLKMYIAGTLLFPDFNMKGGICENEGVWGFL
jgi:hypothetical protein